MCLKYFVKFSSCDHGEYLGSHHCNATKPCDIIQQHFHYLQDNFPVPWSPDLPFDVQKERAALACTACAKKHHDKLDPDKQPVQCYAPTNNFQVEEISPSGCVPPLPLSVVKAEAEDKQTETKQNEGSDEYDYDYKALSAADDDEWHMRESGTPAETQGVHHELAAVNQPASDQSQPNEPPSPLAQQRQTRPATGAQGIHRESATFERRDSTQSVPNKPSSYPTQRRQPVPFVPLGYRPWSSAMEGWPHYTMAPYMMQMAPLFVPSLPQWYEDMPSFCPVSEGAITGCYDPSPQPMPLPAPSHADTPTIPAVLPQRPATPPSIALPQRPLPPPFIVGAMTDAYLRIQAARRRHLRERSRRARLLLRDALPTRTMALTNLVVNKRITRGRHRHMDGDGWSRPPLADEELDTEAGAEVDAGVVEIAQATCRFSCRLVALT
ncbi:hypothetical protein SVAN01_00475 [Stagonosporopsis vannaccii]|nr:hypothetical protein SVAN01_00475 [Stagonosporopsis vannaccii]